MASDSGLASSTGSFSYVHFFISPACLRRRLLRRSSTSFRFFCHLSMACSASRASLPSFLAVRRFMVMELWRRCQRVCTCILWTSFNSTARASISASSAIGLSRRRLDWKASWECMKLLRRVESPVPSGGCPALELELDRAPALVALCGRLLHPSAPTGCLLASPKLWSVGMWMLTGGGRGTRRDPLGLPRSASSSDGGSTPGGLSGVGVRGPEGGPAARADGVEAEARASPGALST
mmetsp:Transcript_147075/g.256807  ORF Transcript_147075/g.256807 Transcript_147075/m.256807 type:complete len:237 (-) Transcript_147075:694-1404(-)